MAKHKKKANKAKSTPNQSSSAESQHLPAVDGMASPSIDQNDVDVPKTTVTSEDVKEEKDSEQVSVNEVGPSPIGTITEEDKEKMEEPRCSEGSEDSDAGGLKEKLDRMQEERDRYESQYNMLLSKLSSMKTIFSKMKEAQQELEDTKEQLSEYENRNMSLKQKLDSTQKELTTNQATISTLNDEVLNLNKECETLSDECTAYKSEIISLRSNIANVSSEKSNVASMLQDEIAQLQSKLQNLEVMINYEKQDKRDLQEQVEDYKLQLNQEKETKNQLDVLIKSLETALGESENSLSEKSRQHSEEINLLKNKVDLLSKSNEEKDREIVRLTETVKSMEKDIECKEKFENEAKERALQIGKLRHEAIILNEHLTKALAMLKHSNDSETVDKELISNLFISFVTIPRGDPKKFEVLELISSFLNWDSDKKSQAGLIQNANGVKTGSRTQNFVSLWTEFLEKESEN